MTTPQELEGAATKVMTTMGVITKHNVVAQVEGLLSVIADLCAAFPVETKSVDPRAWTQAAIYGKTALQPHLEGELVKRLHETCRHPDWEYTSVEHPRKCGYSNEPPGVGWVENNERDYGVTRYDNTEDHHFRRLKSDALKDDIDLSGLPNLNPPAKMYLVEYLAKLRERFCKGYMPSSTSAHEFNSKPEYVTHVDHIVNLYHDDEVYCMETWPDAGTAARLNELVAKMGENIFYDEKNQPSLIYGVEVNGLRILTNLGNDSTFVTAQRRDGTWMDYTKWSNYLSLPIDRPTLDKLLEKI